MQCKLLANLRAFLFLLTQRDLSDKETLIKKRISEEYRRYFINLYEENSYASYSYYRTAMTEDSRLNYKIFKSLNNSL